MIQTKTKILIRDNSAFLEASCINYSKNSSSLTKGAKIGNCIKASISKIKSNVNKGRGSGSFVRETNAKSSLQNLLVIQTKKPIYRGDGSTLQFAFNSGVSIILKKVKAKKAYQLGFKRINSTIPFELKDKTRMQKLKAVLATVKLAKHLV